MSYFWANFVRCEPFCAGISFTTNYIFGSQDRGTVDNRGDVDVLVVTDFHDGRRKMQVEMDRVLRGIDFARDIVPVKREEYERDTDIPGTIAQPTWQEGRVVYERRQSWYGNTVYRWIQFADDDLTYAFYGINMGKEIPFRLSAYHAW